MSLRYELFRFLSLANMSLIPPLLGLVTWVLLGRTGWVQEDVRALAALFVLLFLSTFCVIGGLLSYQLDSILKELKK